MAHDPRDIKTEADASPGAQRVVAFWEGGFGTFTLPSAGKVTIGRLNECEVRIDHPSVSRQHAELHIGPPMTVVDLGSFNGTRVAGTRAAPDQATVVPARAVIEIGSTFLVVEGADNAASRATLPPPRPAAATSRTWWSSTSA